jgi:hypothetical protein
MIRATIIVDGCFYSRDDTIDIQQSKAFMKRHVGLLKISGFVKGNQFLVHVPKLRRAQDSATFLRLVAADPLRADARGALPCKCEKQMFSRRRSGTTS